MAVTFFRQPRGGTTGDVGQRLEQLGQIRLHSPTGHDDQINAGGKLLAGDAKRFAEQPLPTIAADRAADAPTLTVTISGKYCESGDVLVRDAKLAPVSAGDLIAIPASGAYAPSMASTYNANGRPAIVMVDTGEAKLIRRRESYTDLMAQDVV